jgi:hypothetical protein
MTEVTTSKHDSQKFGGLGNRKRIGDENGSHRLFRHYISDDSREMGRGHATLVGLRAPGYKKRDRYGFGKR